MRKLILFAFLWVLGPIFAQEITVEKIWKKYEYWSKGVEGFNSLKDGDRYTQLDDQGNLVLVYVSKPTETPTVLISASSLNFQGKSISIEDYSFDKSEEKVLIMTEIAPIYRRSYTAVYYLYDLKTKKLQALSDGKARQTLAEYSPDGTKVSYIQGNDLFVKDITSGKITKITNDGKRNKVINGTTDWVYEEEFSITKAYSWSPDSKYIAFLKFIEKDVKDFSFDVYGELYPESYKYKYPKAGEDNSIVKIGRAHV